MKWHCLGISHHTLILKSESKLRYTQYQEYSTVKQQYTFKNGEKTLVVRILAMVSKHAVIPLQVCICCYTVRRQCTVMYAKNVCNNLTNIGEDENKKSE